MLRIPKRWEDWAYGLVGGCIGGGAGAASAWLGLAVGKAAGLDVPTLNLRGLGIIFLSGVLTHGLAYLTKSPLPPPSTGNMELFTKQQSNEKSNETKNSGGS